MFRLNNWRRLGVGAKIGRGTDRRSVPSTVLVPDQPEMKLCKLRAQEKTNLSYLVTVHMMCSLSIINLSRRGRLYPLGMVDGVYVDTQGEWSSPKSGGDRLIEAHFKLRPILNPSLRRGANRSGGKKKVTQQASVKCLEIGLRYLLSAMKELLSSASEGFKWRAKSSHSSPFIQGREGKTQTEFKKKSKKSAEVKRP
ncbi:hypothetical protein F2Q69_00023675 [Brassica cretica]|uniref:Uncharacterized protein n=1 Tax=Brassica cretica TaxID=69181 RepID=A0A8S9Q685_BRACR|nr:hypothetical protein F2Q69_00023675 [Brassica cretica]